VGAEGRVGTKDSGSCIHGTFGNACDTGAVEADAALRLVALPPAARPVENAEFILMVVGTESQTAWYSVLH
jgi:hypothetical protein